MGKLLDEDEQTTQICVLLSREDRSILENLGPKMQMRFGIVERRPLKMSALVRTAIRWLDHCVETGKLKRKDL